MADDLLLARLQFAFTAGGHYVFVVLTLGLATLLAVMQTRALFQRGDARIETVRMVRFWGQLYVINYGMGIVTGLVMELQFGLGWPGLTEAAADVFGVPLAVEALVAFFLESTLLGLWVFGWHRLPFAVHTALIWGITLTAYGSVFFILLANGFLQNPTGVQSHDGVVRLVDLGAFVTNPAALRPVPHILFGAVLAAGAVVAGLSAGQLRSWSVLSRPPEDVALLQRSLRWGMVAFCIAVVPVAVSGAAQWELLQPAKFAIWQGDMQALASIQAEASARFGPGDYTPPLGWVRLGAYTMLGCWGVLAVVAVIGLLAMMRGRGRLYSSRRLHKLLVLAVPLPFVAVLAGWIFREVGRQPWVIYEMLTTGAAAGHASHSERVFSFICFVGTFALLALVNWWLLARQVRKSPETASLGMPPVAPAYSMAGERPWS